MVVSPSYNFFFLNSTGCSFTLTALGQRDFGAALTFDACSVSQRQFNFTSDVELTFVVLLDLPSSIGIYGNNGYIVEHRNPCG
jgi:hypothetical protein